LSIDNLITDHIETWTTAHVQKKSGGRGRSKKSNSQSQYGVKKLRELILDLAVRGKLIPQSSNDEPASVLLKKVSNDRTRLVREGKIKKQKPAPTIHESELPFQIPRGWQWERFPNVCDYSPGKTPSTKNPVYWPDDSTGIPWVCISDMTHNEKVTSTQKRISQAAVDQVFKRVAIKSGSLLMSFKLTVGKISTLAMDAYHNEAIISIKPFDCVSQEYISWFLPTRALAGNTKSVLMGDTLNATSLSQILLPIPPLAEQHRIVAKVDELMALCDQLEQEQTDNTETHQLLVKTLLDSLTHVTDHEDFISTWKMIEHNFDLLFTTEASIDELKQTILQLAVMGKLVPQDTNDEPASELLKKIAAEKARLVKTGKIKTQKVLPEISEDEKPFELPNGWEWVGFNNLIHPEYPIGYGVLVPGPDIKGGIPLVRIADLSIKKPLSQPGKSIAPEIDQNFKRTRLNGGEILMGVVGSIGKLGIAPDSWRGANIARAICRIIPNQFINKDYLIWLLQSEFMQRGFVGGTRTLAQPTLNISLIRIALTPLPPLNQQLRIVAKVEELMNLCDSLKDHIYQAQAIQVQLAVVVVDQARF